MDRLESRGKTGSDNWRGEGVADPGLAPDNTLPPRGTSTIHRRLPEHWKTYDPLDSAAPAPHGSYDTRDLALACDGTRLHFSQIPETHSYVIFFGGKKKSLTDTSVGGRPLPTSPHLEAADVGKQEVGCCSVVG